MPDALIAWPRALCGPVWGMARPARPAGERAAVREAAAVIRAETKLKADEPVARAIAARVVKAAIREIARDEADPLASAMAELEQKLFASPFVTLATCAEIDTAREFVERRVERLRARGGRYLTPAQQSVERAAIAADLSSLLAARYLRHLRSS